MAPSVRGMSPLSRYYAVVRDRPRWFVRAETLNSMLVNDMRALPPDYFPTVIAFYSSLAYRLTRIPHKLFIPITLEGLLQAVSARVMFQGVPTDSGAVIPIKRFAHGGYRSFAATWAMMLWSREEVLVPYAGLGFVRAKPNDYNGAKTVLLVDEPDDIIELTDKRVMVPALVYRGDMYSVYYDYLRVGVRPPRRVSVGGTKYTFEESRGPMKQLMTTVHVLVKPLVFFSVSVESVVSRLLEIASMNEYPVDPRGGLGELLKAMPAIGFKNEGVLEWVEEFSNDPPEGAGPEYFLFAEIDGGRGYVALRPMPRGLWGDGDLVDAFTFLIRPTPPYYYGIFHQRRTPRTPHVIPGSVVRKLPKLAYEVGSG